MIEQTMLDYLTQALSPIPVYTELPADKPDKFVSLERTGGSGENLIETATIAFQSWAPSLYEAADLNQTVKAIVGAAIALDDVSGVSLASDGNYTDTNTKKYRYQAVFRITHY